MAWSVPMLAEQKGGWSLMIFCARATRGRGLPSLDARSGKSFSPHPLEEKMSELGGITRDVASSNAWSKVNLGHPSYT